MLDPALPIRGRLLLAACLACPSPALAQEFLQTVELREGWNAVHLEVEPSEDAIESVFADVLDLLESEGIWHYVQEDSAADFLADPREGLGGDSVWRRFLPEEPHQGNLHHVEPNRTYLLKLRAPTRLGVAGRPSLRPTPWIPNAWNLRGFPIDPDAESPPTFEEFLAFAPALAGQDVKRLEPSGEWDSVEPGDSMRPGESYWVFCAGPCDFTAPLEVETEHGDGLEFGSQFAQQSLRIENRRDSFAVVSYEDVLVARSLLSLQRFEPTRGLFFEGLAGSLPEAVRPASEVVRTFGFRHGALEGDRYESVLVVRDGRGTRRLVPVTAQRPLSSPSSASTVASDFAGLWVGEVTVDAVQEVQAGVFDARAALTAADETAPLSGTIRFVGPDNDLRFRARRPDATAVRIVRIRADDTLSPNAAVATFDPRESTVTVRIRRDRENPTTPVVPANATTARTVIDAFNGLVDVRDDFVAESANGEGSDGIVGDELSPVPRPLRLRMLLHQDAEGEVRLLREAVQMWREGSRVVDPETGFSRVDPSDPGRYVLVTETSELARFEGSTVRGGQAAGRRISSVGFDYSSGSNVATRGKIALGETLSFALELPADHATNPYRHRRHPDHGEGFSVVRLVEVSLQAAPPEEERPEYGQSLLLGSYREKVTGLHRQALSASGSLELRRVTYTDRLND